MARPKATAPAISFHLSGQSIAKFDGVTFYLGKPNSPEVHAKYAFGAAEHFGKKRSRTRRY
ncbi:hypothetical protein SH501x_000395 [Pirellulaceae bacterium SH501]